MMKEIEQKFTYNTIPNYLHGVRMHSVVFRKYICCEPEVRINKRVFDDGKVKYHLCMKGEGNLSRDEIKISISEDEFINIAQLINKGFMVIDIQSIQMEDGHIISFKHIVEMDIRFAEIEYYSMSDFERNHQTFEEFDFFDREVTYQPEYYMKNIWRYGAF